MQLLDGIAKQHDGLRVPQDELDEARFALVAWIDEMILRSNWAGRDEWLRDLLQIQMFRTNRAGEEFYEHLERLRPDQNHARSVYYQCLVFGFEGRYSGSPGDRAELMRQQLDMLRLSGHALDVATTTPVAPPAYELAIRVRGGGGRPVWPVVATWIAFALGVFALGWAVLRYFAYAIPTPPGT
jgi:type IV/VI secretion system ImpK/VasF family protein